jgi:hypothetical protein
MSKRIVNAEIIIRSTYEIDEEENTIICNARQLEVRGGLTLRGVTEILRDSLEQVGKGEMERADERLFESNDPEWADVLTGEAIPKK